MKYKLLVIYVMIIIINILNMSPINFIKFVTVTENEAILQKQSLPRINWFSNDNL